jgi:hypothetical protein
MPRSTTRRRKKSRRRKSRWSLKHVKVEVNLWIANVTALFSNEPVPTRTRRKTLRKARRIVEADYRIIRSEAPSTTIVPARRSHSTPLYPIFGVDENGLPKNVIGDTIVGITSATRAQAVKDGDPLMALAAAVVEQVVVDAARKQPAKDTGSHW